MMKPMKDCPDPKPASWGTAKDACCNGPVKVQGPAYRGKK